MPGSGRNSPERRPVRQGLHHACGHGHQVEGGVCVSSVEWALGRCREHALRRTRALEALIERLARGEGPVSWSALKEEDLGRRFNPATLFRLLTRLERIGVVRKLGLQTRSVHYFLVSPGHDHREFLICTSCGEIREMKIRCPISGIEGEIMRQSGFTRLYHELEFYGLCPKCSQA